MHKQMWFVLGAFLALGIVACSGMNPLQGPDADDCPPGSVCGVDPDTTNPADTTKHQVTDWIVFVDKPRSGGNQIHIAKSGDPESAEAVTNDEAIKIAPSACPDKTCYAAGALWPGDQYSVLTVWDRNGENPKRFYGNYQGRVSWTSCDGETVVWLAEQGQRLRVLFFATVTGGQTFETPLNPSWEIVSQAGAFVDGQFVYLTIRQGSTIDSPTVKGRVDIRTGAFTPTPGAALASNAQLNFYDYDPVRRRVSFVDVNLTSDENESSFAFRAGDMPADGGPVTYVNEAIAGGEEGPSNPFYLDNGNAMLDLCVSPGERTRPNQVSCLNRMTGDVITTTYNVEVNTPRGIPMTH